jgi:hypothetical protein
MMPDLRQESGTAILYCLKDFQNKVLSLTAIKSNLNISYFNTEQKSIKT